MSREAVVLITLVAYKLLLVAIGFWASKRTRTTEDFFIGNKGLGPWVAAVSSSASASSAWSLLGVSGAAYMMGISGPVAVSRCGGWLRLQLALAGTETKSAG